MMDILAMPRLGNADWLSRPTVAFLAPGHIATRSVLPTLKWAAMMARRADVAVVSGFSSRLEQELLQFLLRGQCGVIWLLGRRLYKQLPAPWQQPLADGRVLMVSTSEQARQTKKSARERNMLACELASRVVFPCIPPDGSSLRELYEMQQGKGRLEILVNTYPSAL